MCVKICWHIHQNQCCQPLLAIYIPPHKETGWSFFDYFENIFLSGERICSLLRFIKFFLPAPSLDQNKGGGKPNHCVTAQNLLENTNKKVLAFSTMIHGNFYEAILLVLLENIEMNFKKTSGIRNQKAGTSLHVQTWRLEIKVIMFSSCSYSLLQMGLTFM